MTAGRDFLLAELGRFVATSACGSLPQEILQKAQACVLYGLAVAIASVRAPQARQAAQAVDREATAGAAGSAGGAGAAGRATAEDSTGSKGDVIDAEVVDEGKQ